MQDNELMPQSRQHRNKGVRSRRELLLDEAMNSDLNRKGIDQQEALDYVIKVCRAQNYRPRTLKDYERIWTWFFDSIGVDIIDSVTPAHFRKYIDRLLNERKVSPSTVNIRLTALKAIFNRLHRDGVLKENPAAKIQKLKTDEKPLPIMTDEQIKRLFSVIDKNTFPGYRDYVAMLVMLKEGLRNNEVISLEVDDIDFATEMILLPGAKNKNRKVRSIPMATQVKKELRQIIAETQHYFGQTTKYVFTNQFGEQLTDDFLRKRMHMYAKKSGMAGQCQCSPHVLRHVFATRFARHNGNLRALQKILGHSDISTTQIYMNFTDNEVKEQYNIIDAIDTLDV